MFTIDVHKSPTLDICHTGTPENSVEIAGTYSDRGVASRIASIAATIDITTNQNLGIYIEH